MKKIDVEVIQQKIYYLRGQKVMLGRHLAELYQVPTYRLNEQVKRNKKRFPTDFMFQLTWDEAAAITSRSQNAILKKGQNVKYRPYAFTEQGVAMLSSVLNSDQAVLVNIQIMRIFVKLRKFLSQHKDILEKLNELEGKYQKHDHQIMAIFDAIRRLMKEEEKPKYPMGFQPIAKS